MPLSLVWETKNVVVYYGGVGKEPVLRCFERGKKEKEEKEKRENKVERLKVERVRGRVDRGWRMARGSGQRARSRLWPSWTRGWVRLDGF